MLAPPAQSARLLAVLGPGGGAHRRGCSQRQWAAGPLGWGEGRPCGVQTVEGAGFGVVCACAGETARAYRHTGSIGSLLPVHSLTAAGRVVHKGRHDRQPEGRRAILHGRWGGGGACNWPGASKPGWESWDRQPTTDAAADRRAETRIGALAPGTRPGGRARAESGPESVSGGAVPVKRV